MVTHPHAHVCFSDEQQRRIDPTRCTDLRNRLNTYFRLSLNQWRSSIRKVLVDEDALALAHTSAFAWEPSDRLDRFAQILRSNAERAFLERNRVKALIVLVYNRGRLKAFNEFGQSRPVGKANTIFASKAAHELTGITEACIQQMIRAVSDGVHLKEAPFAIYKDIIRILAKVAKPRLNMLTQNIITEAYNNGKLEAYRELKVKRVGVVAEAMPRGVHDSKFKDADVQVLTAGDNNVCPICEDLEGTAYDLEDAFGVLPAHMNCRCVWIPADEDI
jgi:hypothetical protein